MDPMTFAALAQMLNSSAYGAGAGDSAAIANFGSPVLGSFLSGRKARKEKKKAQKRFKRALNARESIEGRGLQQQEALARQATGQQLAGYDAAKKEAARMGQASKQSALDREQQLGASLTQNLQNRGLGSLTVGGNLQRGLAADTQRQMGGINESLAGMLGELALGRSGVEAQGTANIANIAGQQSDLMSQLAQMRLLGGATAGPTGVFDPGAWQAPGAGWQSSFGEGLGSFMGSMGGGGQGGMGGNADLMAMIQKLFSQGGGSGASFIGPQMPGY